MSKSELVWFKSSYSSSGDGDCVEVGHARGADERVHTVRVRDSKLVQSPELTLPSNAWGRFLSNAAQV
ncbi:DUF397 domain-containing protein [Embleya sp. NPDC056575]|uniref:DUF397 domain-containing protein n=1 Tax=unclassified Embleya TaxID=2699296 RepID=UPI0036CA5723